MKAQVSHGYRIEVGIDQTNGQVYARRRVNESVLASPGATRGVTIGKRTPSARRRHSC